MITTVDIRDDLWEKAKNLAAKRRLATGDRVDLKTIVNEALEEYLKKQQSKKGGQGK